MAEKYLSRIQQLSQSDLMLLLQKNGYGEFEEILNKGEGINGEIFLALNELQLLRWKLSPGMKRNLLSLLTAIKTNPEKFLEKADPTMFATVNRRQSFVRTRPDFREKLEQVIINPKPPELSPSSKPKPALPLPTPPENVIEDFPSPPEEYLNMDKGNAGNVEDHYDPDGYLLPSTRSNVIEENNYEPPPPEPTAASFTLPRHIPISKRAPLALPRESTDARGYIRGPFDPSKNEPTAPPLLPRVQNHKNISGRSPTKTSSPTPPAVPLCNNENEEEPVDYEPIDDDDEEPVAGNVIPQPMCTESNTGSLSRLFRFLKIDKKSEMLNIEFGESKANIEERVDHVRKKSPDNSSIKDVDRTQSLKYTNRPLPPLPTLPQRQPTVTTQPVTRKPEEPKMYENFKQRNLSTENMTTENVHSISTPKINEKGKNEKSKSENDLTETENPTYKNLEEEKKINARESYEPYHAKSKFGKKPLPLPPQALPKINLYGINMHSKYNEESEDYGSYVFNLNDEPFFRNTDRKGAKQLLFDLGDGAFLFRPSSSYFLTLSLKYRGQYFNLGIEKMQNNKIRLNTDGDISPEFATLSDFVEYFTREMLSFKHRERVIETLLSKTLPYDRF